MDVGWKGWPGRTDGDEVLKEVLSDYCRDGTKSSYV